MTAKKILSRPGEAEMYLEDHPRKVTFTVKIDVTVGHHACDVCGIDSPPPTDEVLLERAHAICDEGGDHGYFWAGHHNRGENYLPPAWTEVDGKLVCDGCAAAVRVALEGRRRR